jgi:hypothetical protein
MVEVVSRSTWKELGTVFGFECSCSFSCMIDSLLEPTQMINFKHITVLDYKIATC